MTKTMTDRKPVPGKFVWFELVTGDPGRAQAFYGELLGWKVQRFPIGSSHYEMICAGDAVDSMIGGYAAPARPGEPSHWLSCVSVADVDAAASAAVAGGGSVVAPPTDIPAVGRRALIADPQGAELCLFRSISGDPADADAGPGQFFWSELHTPSPAEALPFYASVVGFTHETLDMGPDGAYHVLSHSGAGRGGVTSHLTPGTPAHWLPYVHVEDPDASLERARRLGATLCVGPLDIPGAGRFGVIQDPTGASLALMKPRPRDH
jgi:predicted enzyme related to lactoylglutathione lyase